MRALTTTLALLILVGTTSQALAQQGVRPQSPRRDAGQNALRMIAEDQASRRARQQPPPLAGPSNIAPRPHDHHHDRHDGRHHDRHGYRHGSRHHGGFSIGGGVGHLYGRSHHDHFFDRHHYDRHHKGHYGHRHIVYVNRSPFFHYNGGYYRYRGYDPYHDSTRRQVVQSPTVIVIDRTGVSTNEVDPQAPLVIDEANRVSARELGSRALSAGNADQAIDFLTEHVLVNEGDRDAERLLGVALVLDGQTELGIALISRAYAGDPEMAFRPLGRDTIDSLSEWRKVQRDVQRYAEVQRTASAWLAAIVLTQEELPTRTPAERLEEARRAGLDVDITDAFQRYLEGGDPLPRSQPEPQPVEEPTESPESP